MSTDTLTLRFEQGMGKRMITARQGRLAGRVAGAWMACAMALLLVGCAPPAPEEALRAAVREVHAAIEGRDAGALKSYLADDFIGPHGMDRDQARRTAALYMMRHEKVLFTLGPLDVDLQESHATVRFTAALTGGSGFLVPERGNVYKVETGWRLEGGDWKLTSARWTPVL